MIQSINYKNYKINYYVEGSGELLLFLHGWPTNSRLWKSQVEVFKKDYKVVTLDWLGFGKSDKPNEYQYTFSKKKDILDIVITILLKNRERINIVAHDIGGPPAILWASENPERVNRLILLNTVLFPFSTSLDKMSHLFFKIPLLKEILVSQFGLNILMKTLTKSKGSQVKNRIQEILGWHENLSSKVKLKAILESVEGGLKNELPSLAIKFKQLEVHKYLVIAKNDPLCYLHMKKLSNNNPDIPAYLIEKCGHYIPVDRPNELNDILIKILEK